MAKSLGSLVARLDLNARGFNRKLGVAKRRLNRFSRGVSGITQAVGGFGVALSGVAVLGGLSMLTRRSLQAVDALAKMADRLGVTTEQLRSYQHLAELSGASTETLEKGLQRLLQNLAEASIGPSEATDALELLGLEAEQLMGMGLDGALRAIAREYRTLENQTLKTMVASDLFGRAGRDLMTMLEQGEEGLSAAAAEAERLGLTLSRVEAAQVEMANDALARMRGAFGGLGNQLTVQLAPALTLVADATAEWLGGLSSGADAGAAKLGPITRVLGFIGDSVQALTWGASSLLRIVIDGVQQLLVPVELVENGLRRLLRLVGVDVESRGFVSSARDALKGAADGVQEYADGFVHGRSVTEQLEDAQRSLAASLERGTAEMSAANAQSRAMAEQQAAAAAEMARRAESLARSLETPAERYWRKLADVQAMLEAGAITQETYRRATERLGEEWARATGNMDRSAEAHAQLQREAERVYASTRTEAERYAAEVERLRELLAEGLISQDTFARAVRAADGQLRRLEDAAARVFDSTRTPLERFEAKVAELQELLRRGLIDRDTFDRAMAAAQERLDGPAERDRVTRFSVVRDAAVSGVAGARTERPARDETLRRVAERLEKIEGRLDDPVQAEVVLT